MQQILHITKFQKSPHSPHFSLIFHHISSLLFLWLAERKGSVRNTISMVTHSCTLVAQHVFTLWSVPLSHHYFCANKWKIRKNPKFFSAGRITYLINTRLLTRGFYIKIFLKKLLFFSEPQFGAQWDTWFYWGSLRPQLYEWAQKSLVLTKRALMYGDPPPCELPTERGHSELARACGLANGRQL